MKVNFARAALAGIVATFTMTVVGVFIAPMMGIPRMNPADMLAGQMGGNAILGWLGHVMIGITLAIFYAVIQSRIPGPPAIRGALFGLLPWAMAMLMVMPMMGMPLFGGAASTAVGSLIGHLVYGATVGAIYAGSGAVVRSTVAAA
jgi:uncharacterized membrane protein YagU involved in acid resistance